MHDIINRRSSRPDLAGISKLGPTTAFTCDRPHFDDQCRASRRWDNWREPGNSDAPLCLPHTAVGLSSRTSDRHHLWSSSSPQSAITRDFLTLVPSPSLPLPCTTNDLDNYKTGLTSRVRHTGPTSQLKCLYIQFFLSLSFCILCIISYFTSSTCKYDHRDG